MTDTVNSMETERFTPPEAQTQSEKSMEAWKAANLPPQVENPTSSGAVQPQTPEGQIQDFWERQQGTTEAPQQDGWQYNKDLHKNPYNGAEVGQPTPTSAPEITAVQTPTLEGHKPAEAVGAAENIVRSSEQSAAHEQTEQRIDEASMRLPSGAEVTFRNMTRSELGNILKTLGINQPEQTATVQPGQVEQETSAVESKNPIQEFTARTEQKMAQIEATNPEHGFQVRAWLEQAAKGMKEWAKGFKEDALFSALMNSKAKEILGKWPGLLEDLKESTENVGDLQKMLTKRQARLARNQGFMQKYVLGRFSPEARAVTTGQKDLQNEQNIWRDRAIQSEQTRIQAAQLVKTLGGMSRLNPELQKVADTYLEQLRGYIDYHDRLIGRKPAVESVPAAPAATEAVAAQPVAVPAAEAAPAVVQAQPAAAETAAGQPVAA